MNEHSKTDSATVYRAPDISLVGEEHLRKYVETNGDVGYLWNGTTCLILTTMGRVSGHARRNALIFSRDGDNYVIIASFGGSPKHPQWYLNLSAEPKVELQVKGAKFAAVARTAASPERERLWQGAVKDWPNYDVYTTRTSREIPVVVVEPLRVATHLT